MDSARPHLHTNLDNCIDAILQHAGPDIRLGLPLGLGKPVELVNALYDRVKSDASLSLEIFTALSLVPPAAGSGIKGQFLGPFLERVYAGCPRLTYMDDLNNNRLPANIKVHEFFFKSGSQLNNADAQQNYICTNYTHAARDILAYDINVVAQLVATRTGASGNTEYSFSCNPEISRDLMALIAAEQREVLTVAQTNTNLPFMENDAVAEPQVFDQLYQPNSPPSRLFSAPNMPVSLIDYAIGLHASTLIKDGGTLQIGIGSLGDAITAACLLRQQDNAAYRRLTQALSTSPSPLIHQIGGLDVFEQGLYGNSEMFVAGFWHLLEAGILKRAVYDELTIQRAVNQIGTDSDTAAILQHLLTEGVINRNLTHEQLHWLQQWGILRANIELSDDHLVTPQQTIFNDLQREWDAVVQYGCGSALNHGRLLHAGFFLGTEAFYDYLRSAPATTLSRINMTNISYVNHLYGDEPLKRAQRRDARFINTVFKATALGAATADALPDGRIVSGVGGQYNFVAQAHELADGRSILALRSTRDSHDSVSSNIVWQYGHTTIPRHLRDIVVTEYGIADLLGKSDRECVEAMLAITDTRFQHNLVVAAKASGKLPKTYRLPAHLSQNTPEQLAQRLYAADTTNFMQSFPFGSDFTPLEAELVSVLPKMMKMKGDFRAVISAAIKHWHYEQRKSPLIDAAVSRLGLEQPKSWKDKVARALLISALETDADTGQT